MTEDNCPRVSSSQHIDSNSSSTKQRKRRKWDQPAETFVPEGAVVPGIFPLANVGSLAGITLPSIVPVLGAAFTNPLTAIGATTVQQLPVIIAQKSVQPKIQDELIAREIVINDADPSIRYRLTKRQTQEEIQKSTGAVVITRGKYRPPNAPSDGEKPLYLHISAGAHLETTVERIKAVDRAAAVVEEMLKQGTVNNGLKVNHLLSTCVYLGFEADPSANITVRIRGPNDQYINHIMNETGATVLLRGRGSGYSDGGPGEDVHQPLHLLISSNNTASLERAKLLAENLLDTICAECGASRVSSCKVYGAVPPPPQPLASGQGSGSESEVNNIPAASVAAQILSSTTAAAGVTSVFSQGTEQQSLGSLNPVPSQPPTSRYPHQLVTSRTSYLGYDGIYPQATALQQVALALRQSTSPATATVAPVITGASITSQTSIGTKKDKRPAQKRKFQELPAAGKGQATVNQDSGICRRHGVAACYFSFMVPMQRYHAPSGFGILSNNPLQSPELPMLQERMSDAGDRGKIGTTTPKKLVQPLYSSMPPPPPPRMMSPPPPPPPKFQSSSQKVHDNNVVNKAPCETVPDTLVQLMEYGDDDDDDEAIGRPLRSSSSVLATPKPFWAV
ncbi:protein RIK isoform X2 [Capsicum annuum]|uniref:protein RIK isoform X2 n=1 Tax=Capsicum annuum TaxID=4072 RepID=UPI001FB07111|nr:protein RIK isoform X2 [Capsicum annuum]